MFMMPLKAFGRSYSPEVLEAVSHRDDKKINNVKRIQTKWLGLLAILGTIIVLFARDAIALLTHNKFTAAAPLVSLWFMLIMIYSLGIPATQVILAYKKNRFIVKTDILIGIVSWGITALAVKYVGVLGAALAILTYFLAIQCVRQFFARRIAGYQFATWAFAIPFVILLAMTLLHADQLFWGIRFGMAIILTVLIFRFYKLPVSFAEIKKWIHV